MYIILDKNTKLLKGKLDFTKKNNNGTEKIKKTKIFKDLKWIRKKIIYLEDRTRIIF